jgi:phosphoglycerate dehydrogenase-like enzyme
MKPGAILINVARGEIIDEEAVADAVESNHLRGVGLDVYVGEFERPPIERLWSDPRVLITPHTSGGSDENRHRAIDVFCGNLEAFIQGRPLENVVDWERGY